MQFFAFIPHPSGFCLKPVEVKEEKMDISESTEEVADPGQSLAPKSKQRVDSISFDNDDDFLNEMILDF